MATHTRLSQPPRASGVAPRRALWQALSYALLVGGALLMMFPFIWMALGSFKDVQESNRFPPTLVPERWFPENYPRAWATPPSTLGRYLLNSLIIAVAGTSFQLVICTLAGYAFAMLRFRGRELLFLLVLATTMIPGEVTLIPNFVTIRRFPLLGGNNLVGAGGSGLYDTYAAMILPGLVGAFNVFLLRQAFMGIPREYWEAAQIDGCNGFDYLRRIMVPLALPTLLTVAVFGFIGRWNGVLWPLLVTRSEALRPVQVAMIYYQSEYLTDYGMLMAASLLVTAPIIALFMLVQRQFIAGVVNAGIKG